MIKELQGYTCPLSANYWHLFIPRPTKKGPPVKSIKPTALICKRSHLAPRMSRSGEARLGWTPGKRPCRSIAWAAWQAACKCRNLLFHIFAFTFLADYLVSIWNRWNKGFKNRLTILASIFVNRHFFISLIIIFLSVKHEYKHALQVSQPI